MDHEATSGSRSATQSVVCGSWSVSLLLSRLRIVGALLRCRAILLDAVRRSSLMRSCGPLKGAGRAVVVSVAQRNSSCYNFK
jgi:hypothetical protein